MAVERASASVAAAVADALDDPDTHREERWRRIRQRVAIAYFLGLAAYLVFGGIPTDRAGQLIWIIPGLGIRALGRSWRHFGQVLIDWLPFTFALVIYDYTRGIAESLGMPIRVSEPVHADTWMFHGVLPTAWLQEHLYHADARWYDAVVTMTYTSHFLVTPTLAAVLWLRNRERFVAFITRVLVLAFGGLTVYILYPMAPPWYAADEGIIDPVRRISQNGWDVIGLHHAAAVVHQGQAAVNDVAAMPSLHTAYATLVTLFLIRRVPKWARVPLACYPLLMGFALVYSGEHYAIDVMFGWVAGAATIVLAIGIERGWARMRAARAARAAQADADEVVEDEVSTGQVR